MNMTDREHQEWLENKAARKNAKQKKRPAVTPPAADEPQKGGGEPDDTGRVLGLG